MVTGKFNHSQVILVGMLSLVNALINPILYGKMSLRYRLGYLYIFKRTLSVCGASKPDGSFFGKILIEGFSILEVIVSLVIASRSFLEV